MVFYATASASGVAGSYDSDVAGENLGESIDAAHDYDGDGIADIVAGAPKSLDSGGAELGRVCVLSGASVLTGQQPQVLYTLPGITGLPPSNDHFGTAVRASDDLNGDGIGDILVGAPDRASTNMYGTVSVHSGVTGAELARIEGSFEDQLGDGLAGAIEDLDGNGFRELVVAGSRSNAGGPDSGVVKCYRLFPVAPASYCTGKTNSVGCVPTVSSSGLASSTSSSAFLIGCSNQINQKSGLLMYAHAPKVAPFQGGTLCVRAPLKRTPPQSSGGSATGVDCTGTFSFDFNAAIQGGTDPTLVTGAEIYAQYWGRDPGSASTTSLSNALRFVINP